MTAPFLLDSYESLLMWLSLSLLPCWFHSCLSIISILQLCMPTYGFPASCVSDLLVLILVSLLIRPPKNFMSLSSLLCFVSFYYIETTLASVPLHILLYFLHMTLLYCLIFQHSTFSINRLLRIRNSLYYFKPPLYFFQTSSVYLHR